MTAATERAPKPCDSCEGAGVRERLVGEYCGWNGVIEPTFVEVLCGACDGTGKAESAEDEA